MKNIVVDKNHPCIYVQLKYYPMVVIGIDFVSAIKTLSVRIFEKFKLKIKLDFMDIISLINFKFKNFNFHS